MKQLAIFLAILSTIALILACGGGSGGGGGGGDRARVRVVNANPQADSPYTVTFGDEDALPDIGYAEYTGYLRVPFGSGIEVNVSDNISVAPILSTTKDLENRGYYTAVLLENAATPTPSGETTSAATATAASVSAQLRADGSPTAATTTTATSGDSGSAVKLTFFDDSREPPAGDNFKIRVINASSELSSFDAYITRQGGELSRTSPVSSGLAFGAAGDYVETAIGTVQVRITAAGKTKEIYNSGDLNFSASEIVSVVILDQNGGGAPVQGIVLTKDG